MPFHTEHLRADGVAPENGPRGGNDASSASAKTTPQEQSTYADAAQALLSSAFSAGPVDIARGLAQRVDHSVGQLWGSEWEKKVDSSLQSIGFKTQAPAAFDSNSFVQDKIWYAQQVGSAAGMMLAYLPLRAAVQGIGKGITAERAFSSATQATSVARLALHEAPLSAATGLLYGSMVRSVNRTDGGEFWSTAAKNGLSDMSVFAAMGAANPFLAKGISSLAPWTAQLPLPQMIRSVTESALRSPVLPGIASGVPGGMASSAVEALRTGETPTWRNLYENSYSMSFPGAAFAAGNHLLRRAPIRESQIEAPLTVKRDVAASSLLTSNGKETTVTKSITQPEGRGLSSEWYTVFGSEPQTIAKIIDLSKRDKYDFSYSVMSLVREHPEAKSLVAEWLSQGVTGKELAQIEGYYRFSKLVDNDTLARYHPRVAPAVELNGVVRWIENLEHAEPPFDTTAARLELFLKHAGSGSAGSVIDYHHMNGLAGLASTVGRESPIIAHLAQFPHDNFYDPRRFIEQDPTGSHQRIVEHLVSKGFGENAFRTDALTAYQTFRKWFGQNSNVPDRLMENLDGTEMLNLVEAMRIDRNLRPVLMDVLQRDGKGLMLSGDSLIAYASLKKTLAAYPKSFDRLFALANNENVSLEAVRNYAEKTPKNIHRLVEILHSPHAAELLKRPDQLGTPYLTLKRRLRDEPEILDFISDRLKGVMSLYGPSSLFMEDNAIGILREAKEHATGSKQLNQIDGYAFIKQGLGDHAQDVQKLLAPQLRDVALEQLSELFSSSLQTPQFIDAAKTILRENLSIDAHPKQYDAHQISAYIDIRNTLGPHSQVTKHLWKMVPEGLDLQDIAAALKTDGATGTLNRLLSGLVAQNSPADSFSTEKLNEKLRETSAVIPTVFPRQARSGFESHYQTIEKAYPHNSDIAKSVERLAPAVYRVITAKGKSGSPTVNGSGTGFMVDSQGFMATANHVIQGSDKVWAVDRNGIPYEAEIVQRDGQTDSAVLKIKNPAGKPFATVDLKTQLPVLAENELLFALGHPGGSPTMQLSNLKLASVLHGMELRDNMPVPNNYSEMLAHLEHPVAGSPIFADSGTTFSALHTTLGKETPSVPISRALLHDPIVLGQTSGMVPGGFSGSPLFTTKGALAGINVQGGPGHGWFVSRENIISLLAKANLTGTTYSDTSNNTRYDNGIPTPQSLRQLKLAPTP